MTFEKTLGFLLVLVISIEQIVGPPAVIKNKHENEKEHAINTNEVEVDDMMQNNEFDVEYKRYLDEVVKTLETDEEFKKKVAASSVDDINSGKIAQELDMVNHNVRSKLDELKRQEVERLRELIKKKEELGHGPIQPSEYEHIDHFNLETFEVKDLDNLIKKVSKDMDKINELRKEQFKNYEMEKQFEDHMKMVNMSSNEQEEYKNHLEEMKKKHANHERIHHPGSKAQLEEVWEKQDHLENQEFDPKIFFHLHDIDSNGYWDQEEVKALFIKELDKMYQAGLPEDDMKERQEEMERMTEHVFKEMDKNGDKLISFQEYMDETKTKEFTRDDGWDTLDKQQIYTQEEYEAFERRRMAEIQRMIDQGLIPPDQYPGFQGHHVGGDSSYMHQYHPNQVPQQGHHPNQMGYHPNQMAQHPNQMPHHPNQMPQHHDQMQQHPNQMPQHPNQMPQHPNQMPQHPNQMPQHPNQMSQHHDQMSQHPNQMPHHPNQMPQHPGQYQDHMQQQAQQYHPQQGYQQNQHPNQVPQQQYQSNPPYQPGSQPNQQQYQNNQQHHSDPNVQQNNQQFHSQNNNGNSQHGQVNDQQPNQNSQQQQYHQNNQQQYQNQPNQNNQQYQPNSSNQQHPVQHSSSQSPPAHS